MKTITVRLSDDDEAHVKNEITRLAAQGVRINQSQAVRSLISRGSTTTDDGRPKTVEIDGFKAVAS